MRVCFAIFRNSTASAIHAAAVEITNTGDPYCFSFTFEDAPATTSTTTYRLRAGSSTGDPFRLNGDTVGRKFGGTAGVALIVEEIAP
jgi:hypothetical protein